jgi:PhzF family phenazine biosynthesis protein
MRQWTVDAFTRRLFGGNPACVLEPLEAWPSDGWMQRLAAENAAGATAFLRRTHSPDRFGLRWFTPAVEVPLCGHATLAATHVLIREIRPRRETLVFDTASGPVTTRDDGDGYEISLPRPPIRRIPTPAGLTDALGASPVEVWHAPYLVAILERPETIADLRPRHADLMRISLAHGGQGNVGVAALAPRATGFDVVDRFFAPGYGLPEDPATGSFHAILTSVLAPRLGRDPIRFHQMFPGRGAELTGRVSGDRVLVGGGAVTVAESRVRVAGEAVAA